MRLLPAAKTGEEGIPAMLDNLLIGASGSRRIATFSVSNFTAAKESLAGAPVVLRTFELLGRCSVSLACFIFVLILVTSSAGSLSAQTFGQITGHVSDPSGAVVPDATITLTNVATGGVRTTVTTGAGDYTFGAVPPGVYNIQAEHSGFKTATTPNVRLSVQQTIRLDFTLEIGATTQEVTVTAAGALLQAENSSLGTVVENQAISQLPLDGRNYLGLTALSANVNTLSPMAGQAGSRLGGDRASQSISVGGQRIMYDRYTLDGVNNTDPDFNTYIVLPSIDALQEFKVQTGVYPAEFGFQATQVNVVTKSGANTFHGSVFEFLRNNTADALPYNFGTAPLKAAPFHWNDYGFMVSGPVWIPKVFNGKNRLFFMVNEEWLKSRTSGQTYATVPTQAELNGDFSAFPAIIYDPSTGTDGSGKTQISCNGVPNVICQDRIDPISANILSLVYHPATLSTATRNYAYPTRNTLDRRSLTLRIDYNQSAKLQWAFRWSNGDEPQRNTGFVAAGGTVGSKTVTHYNQFMGSNTWTITPTLVNQARYGYTKFYNSLGTLSQDENNVVEKLGIPGLNPGASATWGIPNMAFTGPNDPWTVLGDANDGPYLTSDPMWQVGDHLMWVSGKHTLHVGYEHEHHTFNELGNQFSRGVFNFQNNATADIVGGVAQGGSALADMLLGDLYEATYAVSIAQANYVRNVEAAYVDDTYKVRPNLTLTLGLRYELTPPWYDTMGNEFIVSMENSPLYPTTANQPAANWPFFLRQGNCTDPYQGINLRWVQSDGVTPVSPAPRCSNGQFPDKLMKTDYTNWAPRLALSYSPNARTVVRAAFGMFYNHDIANARFDIARNLAARVTVTTGQGAGGHKGVPDLFWNNAMGGGGAIAYIKPPYGYTMQYDHKTSYTGMYLLNIQQQLGQNWSFEAGYLGSFSRRLYGFRDVNQPIPYGYIGDGSPTPINTRKPYPNYGFIQLVHDIGFGNYNALSLKAARRFSSGFSAVASYTFSKSLDDTSGIRIQQSQLFPQDSLCVECDYGLSDFDVRHRMTAAVIYDLPVGKGKRWAPNNVFVNGAFGGWQISTIATVQSGTPQTILTGFDNSSTALGGYPCDRPDVVPGVSVRASPQTVQHWWNFDGFRTARAGTFGNSARNAVVGPGFVNFDAAIHKDFHMWYNENHHLEFRFEAFNAFNHPNWGLPSSNHNVASTFGQINSTRGNMRQLQLAAKYVF
jgi:hypothetical protein